MNKTSDNYAFSRKFEDRILEGSAEAEGSAASSRKMKLSLDRIRQNQTSFASKQSPKNLLSPRKSDLDGLESEQQPFSSRHNRNDVRFSDSINQLKQAMRIKPDVKPIKIGVRH